MSNLIEDSRSLKIENILDDIASSSERTQPDPPRGGMRYLFAERIETYCSTTVVQNSLTRSDYF
ncbi:hypothetical protein [Burkholderia stagnalis]